MWIVYLFCFTYAALSINISFSKGFLLFFRSPPPYLSLPLPLSLSLSLSLHLLLSLSLSLSKYIYIYISVFYFYAFTGPHLPSNNLLLIPSTSLPSGVLKTLDAVPLIIRSSNVSVNPIPTLKIFTPFVRRSLAALWVSNKSSDVPSVITITTLWDVRRAPLLAWNDVLLASFRAAAVFVEPFFWLQWKPVITCCKLSCVVCSLRLKSWLALSENVIRATCTFCGPMVCDAINLDNIVFSFWIRSSLML